MDKLHEIHLCVIIDLNAAAAYLNEARDAFIRRDLPGVKELIRMSLKESESAILGIKEFEK